MVRWIVFAAFAAYVSAFVHPSPVVAGNVLIAALILGWAVEGSKKEGQS